jgi:hypothetical protein
MSRPAILRGHGVKDDRTETYYVDALTGRLRGEDDDDDDWVD